jgi:ribokinase
MIDLCVVGSLNTDLVVKMPHLPRVGETVPGGTFATFPGGKGANQAVAAVRLGARVAMVGRVGDDAFGRGLIDNLRREGIDAAHVSSVAGEASGTALIEVDAEGRNTIVVASGANMRMTAADVDAARDAIAACRVLLLQLEVPDDAVLRAAEIGRSSGALVCLDPAPVRPVPEALYGLVDVIDPNEVEAQALTGIEIRTAEDAGRAAAALRRRGPRLAVVKMGERGAYYLTDETAGHVPALPVDAVDTTAAGDVFAAALGVALGEGRPAAEAVRFATRAAGLKVTRMGAQPGMPSRAEVDGGTVR